MKLRTKKLNKFKLYTPFITFSHVTNKQIKIPEIQPKRSLYLAGAAVAAPAAGLVEMKIDFFDWSASNGWQKKKPQKESPSTIPPRQGGEQKESYHGSNLP